MGAYEDQQEALSDALDDWLSEQLASGAYPDVLKPGLIVGWALVIDGVDAEESGDSEGWYSTLSKPRQRPGLTLGLHHLAAARLAGPYIGQGIADLEEGP